MGFFRDTRKIGALGPRPHPTLYISLPALTARHLGLKKGDKVVVTKEGDRIVITPWKSDGLSDNA